MPLSPIARDFFFLSTDELSIGRHQAGENERAKSKGRNAKQVISHAKIEN